MGKVRNQKWICLLLVITVMISGICLENLPANSYFSCRQESTITGVDSTFKNVSVYRTETLSQREVLNSLRLAGRYARRSQLREAVELFFSNADILPQNFQSTWSGGEGRLHYENLCSFAILTYIHNQDGEKA